MELNEEDLLQRPKKLELQESKKYKFSSANISDFEALLLDVYAILCPRELDYEHRRKLVRAFDSMAKETYGCNGGFPIVEAFGSFAMDMFTVKSDLDLSLNFSADGTTSLPREKKISVLRKFAKILYGHQRKGNVSGVSPILKARVPVLKVVDRGTGIECDISVENKDGISRSLIINLMCFVDERFRILCFLMKAWAKAHDINSAKDRTLSSFSIILLVAFHLQTRDPPVLPPFSALLKDGPHPVNVKNLVHGFKDFGKANKELIAELFIALLSKLSSVRSLWELGLCASTYKGFWIYKKWNSGGIGVEDFLDHFQNCARAVEKEALPKIYSHIDSSLSDLVKFMNGQMRGSDLRILLFGPVSLDAQDVHSIHDGLGDHKRINRKKKADKKRFPSHDTVEAFDNAKKKVRRAEPMGRPDKHYGQIPSNTAFYSNPFVPPLYDQSIPGQFNYGVQDHMKSYPEPFNFVCREPQPQLLSPALAFGPQHQQQPPFGAHPFGYVSHHPRQLVPPNLTYGPSEPYRPFVPLGLRSGQQPQPPLVSYELQHRPFLNSQPPVSQSHLGVGSLPVFPSALCDERQITQLGYNNQYP